MTSTTPITETKAQPGLGQKILGLGDRYPWVLFLSTLIWLPAVLADARGVRLWLDEIVTLYLSRMPNGTLISALRHGVDLQPPFFYWVTHGFERLFGFTEPGVRAPAIFFFFTFTLILFQIVRTHLGAWYGWMAVWVTLNTLVFGYSTAGYSSDARPYAMLVAFASLSLLCATLYWERPRLWKLVALAAAVAATVSTHYYGIFAILPLLAGEAFRWSETRKIDIRIPVAIAVGLVPLLFLLPIARAGIVAHGASPWNPVTFSSLQSIYGNLLSRLPVPFFLTLGILFFCWRRFRDERQTANLRLSPGIVAGISYLAIPIPAIIVARVGANMIFFRYLLPVVIGLVLLCTLSLYRAAKGSRAAAALVSVFFMTWFLYVWAPHYHRHLPRLPGRLSIAAPDDGLPVIMPATGDHASYFHYGDASLRQRLFILTDPAVESRYPGQADVALTMIHSAPFFSFHTIDFPEMERRREFYVFEVNGGVGSGWLIPELMARGAQVEITKADPATMLYHVRFPVK